jgi:signal transduction histidine kinase
VFKLLRCGNLVAMKSLTARRWLGVAALHAASWGVLAQQLPDATPVLLTNIQQIVALDTNALDARRTEVRVQGVIIYVSNMARRIYVQDGTNAVQINMAEPVTGYQIGHRVEVKAVVGSTRPLPYLINARATVLGQTNLPYAPFVSPDRLAAGDARFPLVKTRGAVRDMISGSTGPTFLCSHGELVFELMAPTNAVPLPRDWLDAEVEAVGICFPFFNSRQKVTSFRFHALTLNHIKIVRPGTGALFDQPCLSIAEAVRKPQQGQKRIKISGTVTAHQPLDVLFLDDGTGPMRVNLLTLLSPPTGGYSLEHDPLTWLQPGERVEAIGVLGNSYSLTPTLTHGEFRRMGTASPVAARPVSISELVAGKHPGQVVSVEGRLLDQRSWTSGTVHHQSLVLQSGDRVFQAAWENEDTMDWSLAPKSYVRVTGVNDATQGSFKGARLFQILLRSPADVVAVAAPPFWTRPQVWRSFLAAAGVGIIAVGWILFQRWQLHRMEQRVAERTSELRGEVTARQRAESELRVALAAEKELNQLKSSFVSMVSHEFRTPLEVILSSSNILDRYLDRLPMDKRKSQLRAIRKSVHRMNDLVEDVLVLGKFDAGRMTCAPVPLNLAALCRRIATEIETAAAREGVIHLQADDLNGEACADEGLLTHILTNLLSNALKFSAAGTRVEFLVSRHAGDARFLIRDRGCGIPATDRARLFTAFYRGGNVGQTPGSGLGLVIVKRCVDLHEGSIQCESEEGKGTTFTVTLPLFDRGRQARALFPTLTSHE